MEVQAVFVAAINKAGSGQNLATPTLSQAGTHPRNKSPMMWICGQMFGKPLTSFVSVQFEGGCGRENRRSPTGGAAKGIEWNTLIATLLAVSTVPCTGPCVVWITGVDAACVATTHTAATAAMRANTRMILACRQCFANVAGQECVKLTSNDHATGCARGNRKTFFRRAAKSAASFVSASAFDCDCFTCFAMLALP